jgi:hypothetical protein
MNEWIKESGRKERKKERKEKKERVKGKGIKKKDIHAETCFATWDTILWDIYLGFRPIVSVSVCPAEDFADDLTDK